MAKSLRSKWRRKCRAVKRVRYGQKELERLKKTLGIDETKTQVDMTEIAEIATVTDAKTIEEKKTTDKSEDTEMDTEGNPKRVFNAKTMRDQNGTYPIWMHPRKMHRNKKQAKKKSVKRNNQKKSKK